jgi:long-chain acyl-CoA synthetase
LNVAHLFLGEASAATVTQVRGARFEMTRTSEELRNNVANFTASLRELGIRSGDRILILSHSRIEVIECILASFCMGAAAMPISPLMGRAAVQTAVQRLKPTCCVFEDPPEQDILSALAEISCAMVSLKDADGTSSHWYKYRELLEGSCRLEIASLADEHPALLIHTSGSSGVSKVVAKGHGALVRYFEHHSFLWSQYSDSSDSIIGPSVMVTTLPLNHLGGLSHCLQGILNGGRSYLMSSFLPQTYLRLIEKTRCTFMMLTPSFYRSLMKEPFLHEMDRSALRCCMLGGEPSSLELIRRVEDAFGVPALAVYAMTECLSGIGHNRQDLFARRIKPGSCGRLLLGELSLRDADGVAQENSGELWVRNATVHDCYLDPEMNQARLRSGWFRTGDVFARDEDGDFFHRGRVDDMFICNGKNIYPVEMEQVLLGHSAVDAVCAAPVASQDKSPLPAVLVVASQPMSTRQIRDYFRRHGPTHAIPQFVQFVDALPMFASGKIDRAKAQSLLQAAYESGRERVSAEQV